MQIEQWNSAKAELKQRAGDEVYSAFFARLELEGGDSLKVTVSAATKFIARHVETNYSGMLKQAVDAACGRSMRLEFTVRGAGKMTEAAQNANDRDELVGELQREGKAVKVMPRKPPVEVESESEPEIPKLQFADSRGRLPVELELKLEGKVEWCSSQKRYYATNRHLNELIACRTHANEIIAAVGAKHGVPSDAMKGPLRTAKVAAARHEAMYRIRMERNLSLVQIGAMFRRDHTTVLNGIRRHAKMLEGLEDAGS